MVLFRFLENINHQTYFCEKYVFCIRVCVCARPEKTLEAKGLTDDFHFFLFFIVCNFYECVMIVQQFEVLFLLLVFKFIFILF